MLYCYECKASFKRLRDLKKHERVHRRIRKCSTCETYFTSREQEFQHKRDHHQVDAGTQTEAAPKPRWSKAPRWRPAIGQVPPTPKREVESVVVAPPSTDDEWVLELNDPIPLE